MNVAQLVRNAHRVEQERNEMAAALQAIKSYRIMDSVTAIQMRAIARAVLVRIQRHDFTAGRSAGIGAGLHRAGQPAQGD